MQLFSSRWYSSKEMTKRATNANTASLKNNPISRKKFTDYVDYWVDVDTHLEVAEVPTEEEICNAVLNSQTFEQADIDGVEEENSE